MNSHQRRKERRLVNRIGKMIADKIMEELNRPSTATSAKFVTYKINLDDCGATELPNEKS